jgi:hypothetical protein
LCSAKIDFVDFDDKSAASKSIGRRLEISVEVLNTIIISKLLNNEGAGKGVMS